MTYDPTTDNRPRCPITGPGIYEQADGGKARVEERRQQNLAPWRGVDGDGDPAWWTSDGSWAGFRGKSRLHLIRYLRPLETEQPDPDALKPLSDADLDAAEASAVEAALAPFKAERERREEAWKAFVPEAREFVAAEYDADEFTFSAVMVRAGDYDQHPHVRAVARALASKATA